MTGKLTAEAVDVLMKTCLASKDADMMDANITSVEGLVNNYLFDRAKIAIHSGEIKKLLGELPENFRSDKGGGWSFLNACVDHNERQWGEHRHVEALFCLGIAAGFAKWLLPRDMWSAMPGGMPYVATILDQP